MYIRGTVIKFNGKKFLLDIDAISQNENSLGSIELPKNTSMRLFPSL
jgi:hypothetical protein